MKPLYLLLTGLTLITSLHFSYAQDKSPVKYGKVTAEDFDLSKYTFDSSASAVIISDVGNSSFIGNDKGWFSLNFKRQQRIKIINKTGFEAASITIPLYFNGKAEEKLENLKAVTYNLENGKITETKLESSAVFKDKLSKNIVLRKFTFPAVKEGSIIEYSYNVESDFLDNLQHWTFQHDYPCIWSEYEVRIPQFFGYVFLNQGYKKFHVNNNTTSFQAYRIIQEGAAMQSEYVTVNANVVVNRWVQKDVPALKEESFTSSLDNHISKIEFQLSEYRHPLTPRQFMGNWITVNEKLMKDEEFGAPLLVKNNWLDDAMKTIIGKAGSPLEKAMLIYTFVRDNFTCTNYYAKYLSNNLKTIFKSRNGNVADINLLLVAMLRHENIDVDPVLLSTRDHGYTNELYPLMNQYNYVIAEVRIDNTLHYLDATHSLGFGKLGANCYNGHARVIGSSPRPVYFDADSLVERKITSIFMIYDEKEGLSGRMQTIFGYTESQGVREKIKTSGEADFIKGLKSASTELDIREAGIDSLKKLEQPVMVYCDFKMKMDEDIIYFNPVMVEGYKENLFKAAERFYPVEMPYAFDETFVLNMEIPKDYTVEELPRSAKVSFNENEGSFEYMIAKQNDRVQLRSRVVLKKAYFTPEEYASLREFYGYVVKKHSEQIVFKKIKH
ncbi:MAG: transglutaminase domain-containing protein [Chitinophagaceae bacterium]